MEPQPPKKINKQKTLRPQSWQEFYDRGLNILAESPTISRFVMKYLPSKQAFVLKVTDGMRIVIKKCNADKQYDQVQKFAMLAGKILTNQRQQKKEEMVEQHQKPGQKKKGKKKKNR